MLANHSILLSFLLLLFHIYTCMHVHLKDENRHDIGIVHLALYVTLFSIHSNTKVMSLDSIIYLADFVR